jgi:hypothetical protein
MKYLSYLGALMVTIALHTSNLANQSVAFTFGQKNVSQNKFIAIAAPLTGNSYKLLIIEQISATKKCWRTKGRKPVQVEPLFMTFDFTGICGRSTDSNGYSVRYAGTDLALNYILTIKQRRNELVLLGIPRPGHNGPILEIGRTYGKTSGYLQIALNPGWRFTRRTFNDKPLKHIYLTRGS